MNNKPQAFNISGDAFFAYIDEAGEPIQPQEVTLTPGLLVPSEGSDETSYSFDLSSLGFTMTFDLDTKQAWDWWALLYATKEMLSFNLVPGWNRHI